MSYRCSITNSVRPMGEKPVSFVTERRERVYYGSPDGKPGRDEEGREWPEVGRGWEVVKELHVSREGLAILQARAGDQPAEGPQPRAKRRDVPVATLREAWALSRGGDDE